MGRIFSSAVRRSALAVGQDHLAHGDDALGLEEHMLGAAEPDALGAEARSAVRQSSGVSALVRTFMVRNSSAQPMRVAKSPESSG